MAKKRAASHVHHVTHHLPPYLNALLVAAAIVILILSLKSLFPQGGSSGIATVGKAPAGLKLFSERGFLVVPSSNRVWQCIDSDDTKKALKIPSKISVEYSYKTLDSFGFNTKEKGVLKAVELNYAPLLARPDIPHSLRQAFIKPAQRQQNYLKENPKTKKIQDSGFEWYVIYEYIDECSDSELEENFCDQTLKKWDEDVPEVQGKPVWWTEWERFPCKYGCYKAACADNGASLVMKITYNSTPIKGKVTLEGMDSWNKLTQPIKEGGNVEFTNLKVGEEYHYEIDINDPSLSYEINEMYFDSISTSGLNPIYPAKPGETITKTFQIDKIIASWDS